MLKETTVATLLFLTPSFTMAHNLRCDQDGQRLLSYLQNSWGEVQQGDPMMINENVIEIITANEVTGNWTRVTIGSDGSACLRTSGVGYGGVDPADALTQPIQSRTP